MISVDSWKKKIYPHTTINKNIETYPHVLKYLQYLVDYVDSNPAILNPEFFKVSNSHHLYDAKTKQDKYGRTVDTTDKYPIEGLTRFYESRKATSYSNPTEFMTDLYLRYDLELPSYLQTGGSQYDSFKERLDNGEAGHLYLKNIYETLKSSLENVDLTNVSTAIDSELKTLETEQAGLIKYMQFYNDVNNVYELFKLAPSAITFTKTDIKDLNDELKVKIKEYQEKEDLIAKFIEAIAKKEIKPYEHNNVFDI